MSCTDNVHNVVDSPISGTDRMEMAKTRELCTKNIYMIADNLCSRQDVANHPQNSKIFVSGSHEYLKHTHINDTWIFPMPHLYTLANNFNLVTRGLSF